MTTTPMNNPQAAVTAAQRVNVYELFLDNQQMPQDDLGAVHYKQGYLDAFFQDSVPDREERRKITTFMQKAVNNDTGGSASSSPKTNSKPPTTESP